MNEQQLEAAARYYCKQVGVDPDEIVQHVADTTPGSLAVHYLYSPQWKLHVRVIRAHAVINEAIEWGKTTTP